MNGRNLTVKGSSILHFCKRNYLPLDSLSNRFSMSRARILNQKFKSTLASNSSSGSILMEKKLGARVLTLNRPEKLNALNLEMIDSLHSKLVKLEQSELAKVIVLQGKGRAFSSGGDVKDAAGRIKQGELSNVRKAFTEEYRLCHTIATYKKPVVAFMNGITMGGGAGLTMHAPFRIACEDTKFAMPETTIGYFTDVGSSFFFNRMPSHVGKFLALTSNVVSGEDCVPLGIATHYVPKHMFEELENRLADLNTSDLHMINDTISEFCGECPQPSSLLNVENLRLIDSCFGMRDPVRIIRALEEQVQSNSDVPDFAKQTLETLLKKSPLSLAVTNSLIERAGMWTISEALMYDQIVSYHMLNQPDFIIGVDAQLISKTRNPKWSYSWDHQFGDLEQVYKVPEEYKNGIQYHSKDRSHSRLWDYNAYPYRA
ncbi:3-hydroxyisobutyryl-CoA hydrolase [Schizosaccharomyces cryophilus OY26]|uniref:3-hydroxyisobutyryl-CoA hydrolase n=1 Tax=Schizosaccharomyces cryophilus (strain OY26 / ATCC MYA-4695 / CBS 11777 / NBRC 106824 / NRRL Y48691) TaxID=653667 RepID=S9W861_SCHCR|nr:3-hydroxyisobutyryl-CoA hydrolase [Schizosaccharomyces cryophilus OY26]EPY53935.1 3-hydroxyisobutyryl-CoA hydrolase [Schizosaccharomyces cryophilus OY26]